jgi:hypothetical protein
MLVTLGPGPVGDGDVRTHSAKGKNLAWLTSTVGGNSDVEVFNKAGYSIANMKADDDGNGEVEAGAFDRKGNGRWRSLKVGP